MRKIICAVAIGIMAVAATTSLADEALQIGGDAYLAGSNPTMVAPAGRDAFVTGFTATVTGKVEKDLAISGFDVNVDAPVGSDVYAAGFSVDVSGPITEDLTAAGFSVHVRDKAAVGGNVRVTGGNVVLDGPITGSLIASAGSFEFNGTVNGDALLTAGTFSFGSNARINGKLTYYAQEPIAIPATVVAAERVRFERLSATATVRTVGEGVRESTPWFWRGVFGLFSVFLVSLGFLLACAAILFAVAPVRMERLKNDALASPVRIITLGALGLSAMIGLVPVSAMTLIGIPLIPIAILAIIALWVAGYVVGIHSVAARTFAAFGDEPQSTLGRVAMFAVALIIIAALNFIPVVGWLINLAIMFLGLGTITAHALGHLLPHPSFAAAVPVTMTVNMPAVEPAPPAAPAGKQRSRSRR